MKKIWLFFILNLTVNLCFSQSKVNFQVPDSLKTKSFVFLQKSYQNNIKENPQKAEMFSKAILLKGKRENKKNEIVDAYLYLYKSTSDVIYLDSMIFVAKETKDLQNVSLGYLNKGNYYYNALDYSKSLDNYVLSRNYSENDQYKFNTVNFNIGLLKLELGRYDEAKKLFLGYKLFLEDNNLTNKTDYTSCLYAIATVYTKTGNYIKSDFYLKLGFESIGTSKITENYSNLLLISGINNYKRKNYKQALEILKKTSDIISINSYDAQNLALSEFYSGLAYFKLNDSRFLNKFKIVDSLLMNSEIANIELIGMYPFVIEYYKKNNDKEKQLLYIEHLLKLNNSLNKKNSILFSDINMKFDIPKLVREKDHLISNLNSKNSLFFWIISIMLFLFFCALNYYHKRIKNYKEKAVFLLANKNSESVIVLQDNDEITANMVVSKEVVKSTISEDIFDQLKLKLIAFEEDRGFLNQDLTLPILAKEFDTNRDYLSKAVNDIKGKGFPQYINELRINYLIKELQTNPKLLMLTIVGIAEEAGFKNSESFANAFKKITGTLPSYYLKALKDQKI